MNKFKQIAAALALAGASSFASAATIDLTTSPFLTGTVDGTTVTYEITGVPSTPIQGDNVSKTTCNDLSGLTCDFDGIGIKDDETTGAIEQIIITFSDVVELTSAYFLDLFAGEQASVSNGLETIYINSSNANSIGYQQSSTDSNIFEGLGLGGTQFIFSALNLYGDDGTNDYALAGLDVNYAPGNPDVPLPAAFWLFGSALLGFMGFSRKKSV